MSQLVVFFIYVSINLFIIKMFRQCISLNTDIGKYVERGSYPNVAEIATENVIEK